MPDSLHAKLLAVYESLGPVAKDGRNEFHHYNYASAEQFIQMVRPPLMAQGILILPQIRVQEVDSGETNHVVLDARYTITDGKETLEVSVPGEGTDKGDKATYKALTGGFKYLMRILFCLPMLDDPEGETGPGAQRPSSQRKPSGTSGGSEGGKGRSGGSTQAQQKKIYAVAKNYYGENFDSVFKPWLVETYGTDHTGELTKAQASEVIEFLEELEKQKA